MAKLTREEVEKIVQEAQANGDKPADFSGVDLGRANLQGVNLRRADLSRANLSGANLSEASLLQANLNRQNLLGANLRGASLANANLGGVDLTNANLSGANLSGASLANANLSQTYLLEANLNTTYLFWAKFSGANLSGANLSNAMINHTSFGNVDLSSVKGLESVIHHGPSTIGLDTLTKSKGKIPEVFLRGCGLSDVDIEYAKLHNPDLTQDQITDITYKISNLLTGDAISYYSCFISYSHQNEDFAQRLHADLQNNGVRCWYAPEDMKIGSKIRPSIDQAIRIHDKLLLVLSEHSVASAWVEHEVEHALELEIERGELVLFPIRLDEAVLRSASGWAGNIKRGRHIGDFTRWKDHDAYQHAFNRLLRDLKTEEPLPLPPHLAAEGAKHKRRDSLRIQLAQHYSNLNKLQEQATIYGPGETPLRLLNQIEAEEQQINAIESELDEIDGD